MYYKGLVECLKNVGYLYLPGIGSLKLSRQNTFLDEDSNNIHLGLHAIVLLENTTTEFEAQLLYLSEFWQTDRLNTRAVLSKLANVITSTCAQKETFQFPGIGQFSNGIDSIKFVSSGQLERSYHYFNQDCQLHKVFISEHRDNIESIQKQELVVADSALVYEESTDYIVLRPKYYKLAAACLLFMCISIFGLSVWNAGTDSFIQPVHYNLDSSEYSLDQVNRSPETDGSEMNTDQILDEGSIELITEQDLKEEEQADAVASNLNDKVEEEACIYILGSFTQEKNTIKMKNRIEQLGLKLYRAPFNGNTRIGVLIPCSDIEALHKLKSLEENYWLLK